MTGKITPWLIPKQYRESEHRGIERQRERRNNSWGTSSEREYIMLIGSNV